MMGLWNVLGSDPDVLSQISGKGQGDMSGRGHAFGDNDARSFKPA